MKNGTVQTGHNWPVASAWPSQWAVNFWVGSPTQSRGAAGAHGAQGGNDDCSVALATLAARAGGDVD
jgi:hypothetical protein